MKDFTILLSASLCLRCTHKLVMRKKQRRNDENMIKEFKMKWNQSCIAVYQSGEGSIPVVLLHGGGVDSALLSWREVMNLMPEKYTVYAIDLPGYGKSDRPDDMQGEYFYQKQISVVKSITNQLHLEKFILSGLSMGGAIAIGFALENPEMVSVLIPVDSWGLVTKMPCNIFYYWLIQSSMMKSSFRLFAKYRWLVRWSLTSSLIGDKRKVTRELTEEVYNLCRLPDAEKSMMDFQRSSLTKKNAIPDYTKRLWELQMPVLFMNGEKDALVRLKDTASASGKVRNSRLHVMGGCRHWAQKERPEEYVKTVDEFIKKQIYLKTEISS